MGAKSPAKISIEITVADLAKASGLSRWKMLRRLRESEIMLRQRGSGTIRKHVFTTWADLKASPKGTWILEAIQDMTLLIERTRRPEIPEEEEDE